MSAAQAYRKGWTASRRTVTCDLEAAESRFRASFGSEFEDAFVRGWVDYAADNEFAP